MFPKPLKIVLIVLIAGVMIGAGAAYYHHQRYKHFAVHQPGLVYRSAWLEPDVMSEVIEEHQFRSVVNLCEPGEMGEQRWVEERDAVRNAGSRLFEVAMPMGVSADDPALQQHIEILSNPDNYPMLVHCQHGVTRTAKFLAIYDMLYRGMSGEESLAKQPLFGRDDHNVNIWAFVKNLEEEDSVLHSSANAENLEVLRR